MLFAHARSGSSNLLRVLQSHPGLRVAKEPFHEKSHKWNSEEPPYRDLITDVASLDAQLQALFAKYNGIKVLDYQLPEDLYSHLLLRTDVRVIALRRRNLLHSVVSLFVARQTGIWKMWDVQRDLSTTYANLQPIAMDELAATLEYARDLRDTYAAVIAQRSPALTLVLEYEQLYSEDRQRNRATAARVFEFLGCETLDTPEIDDLMDPRRSKLNFSSVYAAVPNAREINARLGNHDTGWLFSV